MSYILNEGKNEDGSVIRWITFPILSRFPEISHLFSTREGGVSSGIFSTMNLGFERGDDPDCVRENYRRLLRTAGASPDRIVTTAQTHTTTIRVVTEDDAGKGLMRPRLGSDIDGLVTNTPGLILAAFAADCVPLYFYDPVKRAIGLAHSGRIGTLGRIGAETVRVLRETYGSDPGDLVCVIGPSVCGRCYEVGEDAAGPFRETFPDDGGTVLRDLGGGKSLLDLWEANRIVLREAGVREDRIETAGLCTMEQPELVFSHRASGGKRGNNAALLMIRKA